MAKRNQEKVIEAAKQAFVRYGFRRVTMADIAEAAHMSRPALYLVFPSKEEIFIAVTARVFAAMLEEIRSELASLHSPGEKLAFIFDIWTVRGFELVQASPDAKDLLDSNYEFAAEVTNKAATELVAILTEVLEPLVRKQFKMDLAPAQVAQLLANAMLGFKAAARSTEQLRKMIAGLIKVVLASFDAPVTTRGTKQFTRKRKA